MTFFVISMSLSASLVQNQNNKSKINRNPPSYFLKRDGGFAYVIINLKTKASINSLRVDIYIYRYMISLIYDIFGIFRFKSPAGFHKLAGIIISKRCK